MFFYIIFFLCNYRFCCIKYLVNVNFIIFSIYYKEFRGLIYKVRLVVNIYVMIYCIEGYFRFM